MPFRDVFTYLKEAGSEEPGLFAGKAYAGMFHSMFSSTSPAAIIIYLTLFAFPPLDVIVTLVSPLHSENAPFPMFVTLSGIVTFVRDLQ